MWLLQTCQLQTITLQEQRKGRTIVTLNEDQEDDKLILQSISKFEDDEIQTFHAIAFIGHDSVFT